MSAILIIFFVLLLVLGAIGGFAWLSRMGKTSHIKSKQWNKVRNEIDDCEFVDKFRKQKQKIILSDNSIINSRDVLLERLGLEIQIKKILPSDRLNKIVDLVTIDSKLQYDEIGAIWEFLFDLIESLEENDAESKFCVRTGMSVADTIEILSFNNATRAQTLRRNR